MNEFEKGFQEELEKLSASTLNVDVWKQPEYRFRMYEPDWWEGGRPKADIVDLRKRMLRDKDEIKADMQKSWWRRSGSGHKKALSYIDHDIAIMDRALKELDK